MSTMGMGSTKAGQKRLEEVRKAAKESGIPLSKAQQRALAKELGKKQRGEGDEPETGEASDSASNGFASLAHTAGHVLHAVEDAASTSGHFIAGHAEEIGVPAGVAVVLGGVAAGAVELAGGLGALAALF